MAHDEAYHRAEKSIKQARRSRETDFSLRGMRLTELPESINELAGLQSLDLSRNQLISLPESLESLKKLKVLNLFNNKLVELPKPMGSFKNLETLDLSGNNLLSISEIIGKLINLKHLNFAHNNLTELPKEMGNLMQLQSLNLTHNQITSLPESLGYLIQLRILELSDNKIETLPKSLGNLEQLTILNMPYNHLVMMPDWINNLEQLQSLNVSNNQLTTLPEQIDQLTQLVSLDIAENQVSVLSDAFGQLKQLTYMNITNNQLKVLPESIGNLPLLQELYLSTNKLVDLPASMINATNLRELNLNENPLIPELAEAYIQGIESVKAYLRAKAEAQITLQEAKLILVGEGEVGKTCLLNALGDKPFIEGLLSTHGIEIQQIKVSDSEKQKEITLNGWDFGGQRVYRPTHQLFFSAPAVYLVVWKPREGPQQGFVKEWIQLVKRRAPSARILVVATHGGPQQRQPDIDRQELWDLFDTETVVDFFFVDSKPDKKGKRKNIKELKQAIAHVAAELPEVGRSVPKSFADVRLALQATGEPYLSFHEVLAICRTHNMDDEIARLFITIENRLGHLTHYENDPTLRDIVILRPDWLATAMSYVLDDAETRNNQGLVKFSRLSLLWNDPSRTADTRYPEPLHRIFLRLMERFDLSYRVAGVSKDEESNPVSLIAQLVPDTTPKEEKFNRAWTSELVHGDIQQTQICRIVDKQTGQTANAEGLFYQLIVRLHKFSLGRTHWDDSVHWQRGLVLDADYNGRALLRHIGNDVHITVRAPYPERFLAMLTEEVKYLVESFWEGLRCDVTVPCLNSNPCVGLFEVEKLIENKRRGRPEQPCAVCNEWQNIDKLLSNAPAAQPDVTRIILSEFAEIKAEVERARLQLSEKMSYQGEKIMDRFDQLDDRTRRTLSQVDKTYSDLLQVLTDEAKEGPRLFSLVPVKRSGFNPKGWVREKFKLILWCEHIRMPLPIINGKGSQKGVYEMEFTREWFKKAAPFLKLMTSALSLALPISVAGTKLNIDKALYDSFEDQFNFGKEIIDATLSASDKADLWEITGDSTDLTKGIGIRAENATLRDLHALLKAKDPGFGGLVRVMNKRQEFLWVHEKFASEY